MKATIEFKETAQGNVECICNIPPGTCSVKEKAYMDEFVEFFRAAAPYFGKKRGGTVVVLDPKAKPSNS